ncbi:MAG: MBL fold metallo-hydrolase [Firmicutes bacterium]|jgi:flavorubredoxin|nr:MBL fold metallo-hydrolase [Bacillota bacterium]
MAVVEVKDNVYWVGAVDWQSRYFHGVIYTTHRGTTYNAYLVIGEKYKALIDTVYTPFSEVLVSHLKELVDPTEIDYVVVNHVEIDHLGALPRVMELCPQAKIFCSQRATWPIKKHFGERGWDMTVVGTGDVLDLGGKTIQFIEAPMLHWPDSMFSYIPEDRLLLPNDAFGQHLASSGRFDDEVDNAILMDEAAKYYANILLPFSSLVDRKLKEIAKLGIEIDTIAPSHGVIWRKDPNQIITAYQSWANGLETPGRVFPEVVVVFDTMWGSTEKMAEAISDELSRQGLRVSLYNIGKSDDSDIIREVLEAKAVIVGSSTINNAMLPSLSPFLYGLVGLKPKGKMGAAFGSHGWRGGAVPQIAAMLADAGMELVGDGLAIQWVPDAADLEASRDLARQVASILASQG